MSMITLRYRLLSTAVLLGILAGPASADTIAHGYGYCGLVINNHLYGAENVLGLSDAIVSGGGYPTDISDFREDTTADSACDLLSNASRPDVAMDALGRARTMQGGGSVILHANSESTLTGDLPAFSRANGMGETYGEFVAQTSTIEIDLRHIYVLDLVNANPPVPGAPAGEDPYGFVLLQVEFRGPQGDNKLTAQGDWEKNSQWGFLELRVESGDVGFYAEGESPGYYGYEWTIPTTIGETYTWRVFATCEVQSPAVPEPATLSLLGIGGLALLHRRRSA